MQETNQPLVRLNRKAIDRYSLQSILYDDIKNDPETLYRWCHSAAMNINTVRASGKDGSPPVIASRINGILLLVEAYRRVINHYHQKVAPGFHEQSISAARNQLGESVDNIFFQFTDVFPTRRIYQRAIGVGEYLSSEGAEESTLQEVLITWLNTTNPAIVVYNDLFDTTSIEECCPWTELFQVLRNKLQELPGIDGRKVSLLDFLEQPLKN